MSEGQPVGMESLAGDEDTVFGIIEMVSQERMTQILHVDPDLMGASGLQDQGYQTKSVALMDDFIMGHSGFTMFGIDPSGDDGIFHTSDRSIDRSVVMLNDTVYQSVIFTVHGLVSQLSSQELMSFIIFGHDDQSGSVLVNSVYYTRS